MSDEPTELNITDNQIQLKYDYYICPYCEKAIDITVKLDTSAPSIEKIVAAVRTHWRLMDTELSNCWEFEAGMNEAIAAIRELEKK